QEITAGLRGAEQSKQFLQRMTQAAAPFDSLIKAEGGNIVSSFERYLSTATLLRTGLPSNKAEALAEIILGSQTPLDMLNAALVRRIQGEQAPVRNGQPQP